MKAIHFFVMLLASPIALWAQNRDSSNWYVQIADAARQERRVQQAFNAYEKAIFFDTTNIPALKRMGEFALECRNYRQAILSYTRWYQLEPDNDDTYRHLAELNYTLGRYKEAISFAEKWEKRNRDKPLHYLSGMSFYYLENYPYAINRLLYAAENDSLNATLFYTLGRSYVEMERYKQAITYYRKVADLDSKNARYVYELAMVYYSIPDDKNAIAMFELAAQRGWVQNAEYFENLAYCYLNVRNFSKAVELLQQSLEKRPYSITVTFALAEAQYKNGKFQDAIDSWDKVLQLDAKNARSLYMIGMSYQKLGQKEKGMALCDKAIEMDPSLNNLKQKKMDMGM